MYTFDYQSPASVDDLAQALRADPEAKILAGGMTLVPTLKQRLAMPSTLFDLGAVDGLSGIREDGDTLIVGAMTRHADVAQDATVQARIPALAHLADHIGDAQVRNRGTLGGSIANADPAADYPAAVLGLGATVVTDRREIPGDEMFIDLFETALEEDEIVTAVRFPVPKRAGYAKFKQPASRFALVGVMVADTGDGVRVAVTGAGASVFRVEAMEQALAGDFSPSALAGISVPADGLNNDLHADADYRAHLVAVMARRAVEMALA